MWMLRLTVSLVALCVAAVYSKSYLLLDDVRVFVGKHFLYQIGDEQFLAIYRVYRIVERGQKTLPDWLRYVNKTSQLIGSPTSGDEGLYTIRVKAECIDPLKLRCSDRISRTFLIKVVEPLTAAESRGRKKLSPVHAGRVYKKKRPRVKMTREFDYQHKYTNMILPTRTYLHDPSTTAASLGSLSSYLTHESNNNRTVGHKSSTSNAYKLDVTFPNLCTNNEVSFFASLILHVVHALNVSEAKELKNRFSLFISKDSSLVFLTDGSLGSVENITRKHILTAGPGNVIESLSDSMELSWHLACGDSVDKVVDFAKALQHNVDVGRLTEEIGHNIIAWFIFSDKPVSRRQKREAHNKGRQTGTPSLTPPLPTTITQPSQIQSIIQQSLSISTTSSEYISQLTFAKTSILQGSELPLESFSIETTISSSLQPSFSSYVGQTRQSSLSFLSSTSTFVTSKESSFRIQLSSLPSFLPSSTSQAISTISQTTSSLFSSSFHTSQISSSLTPFLENTSKNIIYPFATFTSDMSPIENNLTSYSMLPSASQTFSSFLRISESSISVMKTSVIPTYSSASKLVSNASLILSSLLPKSTIDALSSESLLSVSGLNSSTLSYLSTPKISSSILTSALDSSNNTLLVSLPTTQVLKSLSLSSSLSSPTDSLPYFKSSKTIIDISSSSSIFITYLDAPFLSSSTIYPSFSVIQTSFSYPYLLTSNTTSVLSFPTPFISFFTESTAHTSLISFMSESLSSLAYSSSYSKFVPFISSSFKTSLFFISLGKSSPSEILFTSLSTDFSVLPTMVSYSTFPVSRFLSTSSSLLYSSSILSSPLSILSSPSSKVSSPTKLLSSSSKLSSRTGLSPPSGLLSSPSSLLSSSSGLLSPTMTTYSLSSISVSQSSARISATITTLIPSSSKSYSLESSFFPSFVMTQSVTTSGKTIVSQTTHISGSIIIVSSMLYYSELTSLYQSLSSGYTASDPTFSILTSRLYSFSEIVQSSLVGSLLSETKMTSSLASSFTSIPQLHTTFTPELSIDISSTLLTTDISETPYLRSSTLYDISSAFYTSVFENISITSSTEFSSISVSSFSGYMISDSEVISVYSPTLHTSDTTGLDTSSAHLSSIIETSSFKSMITSIDTTSEYLTSSIESSTLQSAKEYSSITSIVTRAYSTSDVVTSYSSISSSAFYSSSIYVPSSSVVMSSPSLVLPSASQTFSGFVSTTAAPDGPPKLQFAIDHLEVYVGRYFELKIPEKTFNDTEDGSTSNLNLSISLIYGKPLRPDSWLQFNSSTQTLFGLPLMRDLESGQNKQVLEKFILSASDSKGQIAKDVISIAYRYDKEVTHDITIKFEGDYSKFENDNNALIEVAQKMAKFYGDTDLKHFTIFDVVNGSVILNWGNNSLFGSKCLRQEIDSMYRQLVMENGTVSDNFTSLFSVMDLSPVFTSLELKRVCLIPLTTAPPTKPPVKSVEDEQKFWLTIGLPALIVIVIIIIIALLLLICCRHRRSNKDVKHSEKPSYLEDRRPIIFPEELEMVDPSLKPKNPLILPSDYLVETPPAVPPHTRSAGPPDYQAPVFDDGIFEADDTIAPPAPGIAETATDPPPYRLPPPYYNPHRAK